MLLEIMHCVFSRTTKEQILYIFKQPIAFMQRDCILYIEGSSLPRSMCTHMYKLQCTRIHVHSTIIEDAWVILSIFQLQKICCQSGLAWGVIVLAPKSKVPGSIPNNVVG